MADLSDLGLSEYEARVYRALLDTGPTTAKELSRASGVPMGRIYDVLASIETHSLIRSQSASRPKKYVAVEPETALSRLLEDRRRELEARADQYEEVVEELVSELDASEPANERFWTAAVGAEETIDLLEERLAAAEESVVVVAAVLSAQFDTASVGNRVTERLGAAVDRGVDVSLLMHPDLVTELPNTVNERYVNTLLPHDRVSTRTSDAVERTFTVIDGVETCIEVPHPLDSTQLFAMIDVKDPSFAGEITREFEPRWEGAERLDLG
ncbi:TrmB family transcriptional regulator [Halococcus thailandensis]|uniref:Transcriptional regulator n=1 Tax=Halococcus thailandensis JCM 13552 TaxID=1227457 RepID=M0N4T4_9EURY|nr:helix-turn-helix domain-containing protein [Halococcus thailandensis]EMA52942.1 transcriptional regulator [Halococcus thailandensis JCM 13552]